MARTTYDWLTYASAAADPAEADRCFARAMDGARSCHEWRAVLAGLAKSEHATRERLVEVAARTLASAEADRDVWGFRDVAELRAGRLGDEAGARAALEAVIALLGRPRTDVIGRAAEALGGEAWAQGYEWVLVARGFRETLHDDPGFLRCLQAGLDMARARRNADDLCSVATAWAEHVERDGGLRMIAEAEDLAAENDSARPWTLANAWSAAGDREGMRRVLEGALAGATSIRAACDVARAWSSHRGAAQARRALDRAHALAASASDWLDIAEVELDTKMGSAKVRFAVERAEAASTSDDDRGRLASAYRHWLGDAEAAARVGPRGVRPEGLHPRTKTLEGWETSAAGLFDWLRAQVTPELLVKIAHADYGMDADKHLAALQDICESGLVPRVMRWEPHEVLALTRWSEGEGVDHLERALCSTLLCLSPQDMDELVTNGPILAESCLALGDEAVHLAELFFAWRTEVEEHADERPIALLLLFLLRTSSSPRDERLDALATELVEHEAHALEPAVESMATSMRAVLWAELIDRILGPARASHAAAARVWDGLGQLRPAPD